ncbi:hypothetical protein PSN45_004436 [Yamadazyma tenuis]|uniref:BHLH domain-containing protein n=2 Tax=Candida tenuis (strain ATCC 10573 / BCRC 21748 / CBS 615 / JCM 9827 / NBRC 10315 / NRRL Y-1498 / VKM Y-70) TaxID=590646 RepID=G3B5S0_CANTC|nr:uncharacterized protein CANTEDRAFT_114588 [Yamadazyma tenuis ATCC 10573]EGV63615.1 hypothetical protein CANTEDRAFT_114588 [Yamadazyma tenuis ATCC 10573]WEJ96891.1 hypothetical protein PSN45_004436 [Yamadazyma tenuis]
MAFKLNDYNAFLTSLVEREKSDTSRPESKNMTETLNSPTDDIALMDQQDPMNSTYSRLPIDFDFGLNQEIDFSDDLDPQSTMNLNMNDDNDLSKRSYNPSSKLTNNASTTSTNRASSNSTNNTSDMDPPLKQEDIFFPRQASAPALESNFESVPSSSNYRIPIQIKNESSDDELMSPNLDLPDGFCDNFDNINTLDRQHSNTPTDDFSRRRDSRPLVQKSGGEGLGYGSMTKSYRPRLRSSHNVIEQRYRNKINDKFNALSNSVPTLRVATKRKTKNPDHMDNDEFDEHYYSSSDESPDLEGLEPARKLNKGVILSKSVEYIRFLELKNDRMREKNHELLEKARLLGIPLDKL